MITHILVGILVCLPLSSLKLYIRSLFKRNSIKEARVPSLFISKILLPHFLVVVFFITDKFLPISYLKEIDSNRWLGLYPGINVIPL